MQCARRLPQAQCNESQLAVGASDQEQRRAPSITFELIDFGLKIVDAGNRQRSRHMPAHDLEVVARYVYRSAEAL